MDPGALQLPHYLTNNGSSSAALQFHQLRKATDDDLRSSCDSNMAADPWASSLSGVADSRSFTQNYSCQTSYMSLMAAVDSALPSAAAGVLTSAPTNASTSTATTNSLHRFAGAVAEETGIKWPLPLTRFDAVLPPPPPPLPRQMPSSLASSVQLTAVAVGHQGSGYAGSAALPTSSSAVMVPGERDDGSLLDSKPEWAPSSNPSAAGVMQVGEGAEQESTAQGHSALLPDCVRLKEWEEAGKSDGSASGSYAAQCSGGHPGDASRNAADHLISNGQSVFMSSGNAMGHPPQAAEEVASEGQSSGADATAMTSAPKKLPPPLCVFQPVIAAEAPSGALQQSLHQSLHRSTTGVPAYQCAPLHHQQWSPSDSRITNAAAMEESSLKEGGHHSMSFHQHAYATGAMPYTSTTVLSPNHTLNGAYAMRPQIALLKSPMSESVALNASGAEPQYIVYTSPPTAATERNVAPLPPSGAASLPRGAVILQSSPSPNHSSHGTPLHGASPNAVFAAPASPRFGSMYLTGPVSSTASPTVEGGNTFVLMAPVTNVAGGQSPVPRTTLSFAPPPPAPPASLQAPPPPPPSNTFSYMFAGGSPMAGMQPYYVLLPPSMPTTAPPPTGEHGPASPLGTAVPVCPPPSDPAALQRAERLYSAVAGSSPSPHMYLVGSIANTDLPRKRVNVHGGMTGAVGYYPYNSGAPAAPTAVISTGLALMNGSGVWAPSQQLSNGGSPVDSHAKSGFLPASAEVSVPAKNASSAVEAKVLIFIQMFPCELRDRVGVLNRVIECTCGPNIATVLEVETRSETSFVALVQTSAVWHLIYSLRCRVLMDRFGFWYAADMDQYLSMKRYCEGVRRLPQHERHFQTDGLPCMPLVVELSRSVDRQLLGANTAPPCFDSLVPIIVSERNRSRNAKHGSSSINSNNNSMSRSIATAGNIDGG